MRILFLSAAGNVHTIRWVSALAQRGHEVHLVSQKEHALNAGGDAIPESVKVHYLKLPGRLGYFLNAPELKRLFKKIKPDVVNAHYASGYGTLARMAGLRPLVLSVWGSDVYDFPYHGKFNMNLIRKNLLYADRIVSTSHCMARQVEKLLEGRQVNIDVVPFGVDLKRFSRKEERKSGDEICIGCVKALEPVYGIDILISAAGLLKESLEKKGMDEIARRLKVRIYGDGSRREELQRLIDSLELGGTVYLMGRIPHYRVPEVLQRMDIFCATSRSESFGVAVVEAMAMELPVVVTDAEGFKEVVEDGTTGIIVERNDPAAVAQALERLVLDEKLRDTMGEKGRKRVERLYDWDKNVDALVKVYQKCLHM